MKRLSFTIFLMGLFLLNTVGQEMKKTDSFRMMYAKESESVMMDIMCENSISVPLYEIKVPVYGMSLDMDVTINSEDYLLRIVLEDSLGRIFLMAEDYPAIGKGKKAKYIDYAEETAILWQIRPKTLRIHAYGARVHLKRLNYATSIEEKMRSEEVVKRENDDIRIEQAKQKCDLLSKTINKNKELWIAGVTKLASLSFADRLRIIGGTETTVTDGIEFYSGGVFYMRSHNHKNDNNSPRSINTNNDCIPEFSWRDRHGKDWLTPVKDQGQSGYCCAFCTISCLETVANLYYNQKIDMDLSEQEAAVCNTDTLPWTGMLLSAPLSYIKNQGVCEEAAYPFVDSEAESHICRSEEISPTENIRISNYQHVNQNEQDIKKALIKYGPLASGFKRYDHTLPADSMPSNHAMALYGYSVVQAGDNIFQLMEYGNVGDHGLVPAFTVEENSPFIGRTVWKFKNSYINGDATNPPYMFIIFDNLQHMLGCYALNTPLTSLIYDENDIVWEDTDGDGFYNWGIGDKPSSCPSWVPEEPDGDDSNPTIGPIDEFGNTIDINPDDNPIIYINSDTSSSSPTSYSNNVVVQNNATWTLSHDHHFHYGAWIKVKSGSKLVINACILTSAHLILEPGSKLVISNGGTLITPVTAKFIAPLGATVDISSGTIM